MRIKKIYQVSSREILQNRGEYLKDMEKIQFLKMHDEKINEHNYTTNVYRLGGSIIKIHYSSLKPTLVKIISGINNSEKIKKTFEEIIGSPLEEIKNEKTVIYND